MLFRTVFALWKHKRILAAIDTVEEEGVQEVFVVAVDSPRVFDTAKAKGPQVVH